ncbi:MAG: hypothetical protein IJ115_10170 [Erysipelotrichaceae bacterium]|nr:hypothetical protein [Erysipelotrichaceae bacterium]
MKENCELKIERMINRVIISQNKDTFLKGNLGRPSVAICPNCGEVSIYIENQEFLKMDDNN